MNLILSDVEETIMIVDQPDGAPGAQHTVNVSLLLDSCFCLDCSTDSVYQIAKRKMDMLFVRGDGVILVRVYCPIDTSNDVTDKT